MARRVRNSFLTPLIVEVMPSVKIVVPPIYLQVEADSNSSSDGF